MDEIEPIQMRIIFIWQGINATANNQPAFGAFAQNMFAKLIVAIKQDRPIVLGLRITL